MFKPVKPKSEITKDVEYCACGVVRYGVVKVIVSDMVYIYIEALQNPKFHIFEKSEKF